MSGKTLTLSAGLRTYLHRQASSLPRYLIEQVTLRIFGWIPTPIGMAVRSIAYRAILEMNGWAAIDHGVRLAYCSGIRLSHGSYLDQGVYLHATPQGIDIGARTIVMHGAVLHVYNFRSIPHSGISIGSDSLIGEYSVIRGQGGVQIGDRVYTSPFVQIIAVNHVYDDPDRSFVEQGITAEGITIEDDVWLGSGAIITDGVTVGHGSVVAAGAVVTQDVPPRTVVAGVPAKVVRDIDGGTKTPTERDVYFRQIRGRLR